MKFSTIITKLTSTFHDKEFLKFTGQFLLMMLLIYFFNMFSMGIQSPTFSYAAF